MLGSSPLRCIRFIDEEELRQGKYWGVNYDLAVCGSLLPLEDDDDNDDDDDDDDDDDTAAAAPVPTPTFTCRYDAAFLGASKGVTSRLLAVRETRPPQEEGDQTPLLLPNAEYPSDHLPLGLIAEFEFEGS